jgi:hypothetical protein
VVEAHLELHGLRCPRCGGDMVLRVLGDERGKSVVLTLDSACVACGVPPWREPDERTVVFTPGAPLAQAPGDEAEARLAAAQSRIEGLLRRCELLQNNLGAARRNTERAGRRSDLESELRSEISRLEGALAEARAEVRKAEEATKGDVKPGKRPIEIE